MKTGSHLSQDPEIVSHERAYKAFNILLRWCMVALAASITGLTLWFATDAGFLGGVVVAALIFFVGYQFLVRHEERQALDVWTPGR